ncbi:TIR domain-containing protein [Zobellia roscoffensis]|uniref:TIR domain-containing protein n=1 Tax=Zobellia roscoffensis TaxID=2779508 RepID=UPI00188DAAF3|nr:TIR domain-containing protein [Zobellia roscoffensis]
MDKDTQKLAGSPNIVDSIFKKIKNSDIFICDVTIINNNLISKIFNNKKTPNPNVLIELGYAINHLGWERIICVINNSICKIEDLPFDIKQNRISQYSPKEKKNLENLMNGAINRIIDNYDDILNRANVDDSNNIDRKNFNQFIRILSDDALKSSLNFATSNLRTSNFYYAIWDETIKYLDKSQNSFLNVSIRVKALTFKNALSHFVGLCCKFFIPEVYGGEEQISDYENSGIEITKEIINQVNRSQRYLFPKSPSNNNWEEYHKNLRKVQMELNKSSELVEEAYKEFIIEVKKELLI